MRLVLASDHRYLPHHFGGRESSIHEMATLFQSCGHDVTVLSRNTPGKILRLWSFIARGMNGERWHPSYRVRRTRDVAAKMTRMFEDGLTDAYIINFDDVEKYGQSTLARSIRNQVIYLRDLEGVRNANPKTFPRDALLVANSEYTARAYAARTGRDPLIIRPQVSVERYAVATSGEFVTFVNPVPKKGLDIALEIAASLPDVPFLFVECWPLRQSEKIALQQRIAVVRNVRLWNRVFDMRRVYARTRVLLVPSIWEEGFGRVVVEAQVSGIPSVASNRAGIPEAVGNAGILLSPDEPVRVWADAVRGVWSDSVQRAQLSGRARVRALEHYEAAVSGAMRLLALLEQGMQSEVVPEKRNARYRADPSLIRR